MRKFVFFSVAVFSLLLNTSLHAQRSGCGLGLIFGEPTGLTLKDWLDNTHAITASVAYSVATLNDGLSVNANYVWNAYRQADYTNNYGFQYGAGFRYNTRSGKGAQFGLRGTVEGIWFPQKFPCDFFIEAAPVFIIAPTATIGLDCNAGIRFYFEASHN